MAGTARSGNRGPLPTAARLRPAAEAAALVGTESFPTLAHTGVAYLDSAATSQTPLPVLDAMDHYYREARASVHRGVYPLAVEATDLFEAGRDAAAEWLGWEPATTIFTRNATEAINLVAFTWGRANVGAGDRVVVTGMEHHSNFVPWWMLCREVGATLEVVPVDADGELILEEFDAILARGDVKVVAVAHVSNVLGTINPVAEIVRRARVAGAITVIDGAQAVPQIPVDLQQIEPDFYAWTVHKAYGPTGLGILHGRRELLEAMPPWLGGGHMIASVTLEEITWGELPAKFEAGTSPIAEGVGLAAAVGFLRGLGMDAVREHERELTAYALERLADVPGLTVHGPARAERRGAVISFALDVAHPHDVAEILGREGVCVRAGHHCAQPLMKQLGTSATTRASFGVHTTRDDIDRLIAGLKTVRGVFA
ncbi:MAG TPA: SufS family cysteine desulfurase [Solirubrobacteraceae bacterium]|nr:SufS family cysteine desulfurase [Solirubrobacteraceae bacterium]